MTSAAAWWAGVARLCRLDVRRLGASVSLIVTAEVLQALYAEWSLHRSPPGGDEAAIIVTLLDTGLWLAAAVATAIVVQADHPTDDRGFLRSRPASPLQVALAKLSLLSALFVLLPALVNAARLAWWGAPPASMLASAVQFAVVFGAIGIPAWALALTARTLPRFLVLCGSLTIGWYVAVSTIVMTKPLLRWSAGLLRIDLEGSQASVFAAFADWQGGRAHGWAFALLVTLAAAAILIAFYRYRQPLLALSAGVALLAAPIVIPPRDRSRPADADLVAAVSTGLHIAGALSLPARSTIADRVSVPGKVPLGGLLTSGPPLPVNVSARADITQARIAAAGAALQADGSLVLAENWPGMAAQAAADGQAPADAVYGPLGISSQGRQGLLLWAPAAVDQLEGRVADVDASVTMHFTRHRLVADLPLQAGVTFRTDDYMLEVLSVDRVARKAACRFTRFPTLDPQAEPWLRFFDGSLRSRVLPDTPIRRAETELYGGPGSRWARGRTWALRMDFGLADVVDAATPQVAPRLRIVESRSAGATTTRLTGRGVPIEREPDDVVR